jgi:hypothetical protein
MSRYKIFRLRLIRRWQSFRFSLGHMLALTAALAALTAAYGVGNRVGIRKLDEAVTAGYEEGYAIGEDQGRWNAMRKYASASLMGGSIHVAAGHTMVLGQDGPVIVENLTIDGTDPDPDDDCYYYLSDMSIAFFGSSMSSTNVTLVTGFEPADWREDADTVLEAADELLRKLAEALQDLRRRASATY